MMQNKIKDIKALVLDVDGTMTDGSIYISEHGEAMKRFDVKDGLGISLLVNAGIAVAVITGRKSQIVLERARELKISEVVQGAAKKGQAMEELAARQGISVEEIAYIGDDLNDLPALAVAGCSFCPADAVEEVKEKCHIVLKHNGGFGAVREAAEIILKAQGKYEDVVQKAYRLRQ